MSQHSYDEADKPISFDEIDNTENQFSGDVLKPKEVNYLERYANYRSKLDENSRKNRAHTFSMNLLWVIIVVLCIIVAAEYFIDVENAYTKELFDFFKYIATTLIGYLYASNKNENENH